MGKLSDEARAANKEASKERSRAFNARRRQFEAERTAAEEAGKALPEHAAMVAAHEAFELSLALRNQAVEDIDKEIARLQAQREEVRKQHGLDIDAAKAQRDLTFNASTDATRHLTDAVKARYPDMVGVYLASQWQRPDGI
jgi:glutamate-1-semialdehyde aminotransferase